LFIFFLLAGALNITNNYIQSYLVPNQSTDIQGMNINGDTFSSNQATRSYQQLADILSYVWVILYLIAAYISFKPLYVPVKECFATTKNNE